MSCGLNTRHQFLYPVAQGGGQSAIQASAYPFTLNFAPRSIPPTIMMEDWKIEDTENNTLLYKGTNYQLATVQICKKTHSNLAQLKGVTYNYDIVLSFVNWSNSVKVILVIIPIFEGSQNTANADYFRQMYDENVTPVSLVTLISKSSDPSCYGYNLCLTLYNSYKSKEETAAYNTDVYYFQAGVTLTSDIYTKKLFSNLNNLPPPFRYLPGFTGTWKTLKYDAQGNPVRDPLGGLSEKPLDVQEVSQRMTKYSAAPPTSTTDTCPYIPVSQYKCYPFDELKNLDAEGLVHPGMDLTTGMKQTSQKEAVPALDLSWNSIQNFIYPLIGFIVLIILLAVLLWALSWLTRPPPISDAAIVASAATGTPLPV